MLNTTKILQENVTWLSKLISKKITINAICLEKADSIFVYTRLNFLENCQFK